MNALLTTVSLVAFAASSAVGATPSVSAASKTAKAPANQQYCLQVEANTGSRMRSTECHTKAEWKEQGVDVDQLSASREKSGERA